MIVIKYASLKFNSANILTALKDIEDIVFGSLVLSFLNACHINPQSLDIIMPADYADKFINNMNKSYSLTVNF